MSPLTKGILTVVGVAVTGAVMFLGIQRVLDQQRTKAEIERLREGLYRARVTADRCRSSVQTSQASLLALGVTIDSLRTVVDGYETIVGGVPANRYDDYMSAFDEYNDSVAVWEGRETRLRTADDACRATIEAHNALSDTLQAVLSDAGIVTS